MTDATCYLHCRSGPDGGDETAGADEGGDDPEGVFAKNEILNDETREIVRIIGLNLSGPPGCLGTNQFLIMERPPTGSFESVHALAHSRSRI